MVDGVRERNRNCGDNRILRILQESVELGAGLNGGAAVRDHIMTQTLHHLLPDNIFVDFFNGYSLGRTAPPALLSAAITFISAHKTFYESVVGKQGPVRENELPHNNKCGWSAVSSYLKKAMKFDGDEPWRTKLLDKWNEIDGLLNTLVWEPTINIPAYLISLGTFRIKHNFGVTDIHEVAH